MIAEIKCGWGVAIRRKDGSDFLCASANGILPPVWSSANRRFAVAHKRELIKHGFKARVVCVEYMTPRIVESAP